MHNLGLKVNVCLDIETESQTALRILKSRDECNFAANVKSNVETFLSGLCGSVM